MVLAPKELQRSPRSIPACFTGARAQREFEEAAPGANGPSGGRLSHIELGAFLSSGNGPEQQALFRLIATLVDVPPFWRTALTAPVRELNRFSRRRAYVP
jgi:hypothetical protein